MKEIYLQILQDPVQTKKGKVSSPFAYSAFRHKESYSALRKALLVRLTRIQNSKYLLTYSMVQSPS